MILRSFAAFQTDLPDDGEDDGVNWVVWPGRNIISAVREGLVRRGYDLSEPESQEHLGWWLYLQGTGQNGLLVQISDLGDHQLLVAYDERGFFHRLFKGKDTQHRDLVAALAEVLGEPPFREVRWYTREEYLKPGAPDPGDLNPGAPTPFG